MTLATAVTLDALRIMPVVEPKPALYIEQVYHLHVAGRDGILNCRRSIFRGSQISVAIIGFLSQLRTPIGQRLSRNYLKQEGYHGQARQARHGGSG